MKEQVARELPPKTELVRPVELRGDQRELYESIRVAAHAEVRRAHPARRASPRSTIPILDALTKLRQVCCDPRLLRSSRPREVRDSAKYEMFFELLDEAARRGPSRPGLLAVHAHAGAHRGRAARAQDRLRRRSPARPSDRQQPIDQF